MKIHLIAIGGSAMHNLAISLFKRGFEITGSDDSIYEPSKSRLEKYNLLPKKLGWYPDRINSQINLVILGMHAREDNAELIKARKLNLSILSYPEYIYEESKNKKRVVIGGSHGKTTITSMIMHVLNKAAYKFDYMVGAQLNGFDTMVKITEESKIIILEGDEYLSSTLDKRPKFHLYKPHIAVISGIAWDHINVFPTFENYIEQFRIFKNMVSETLIYFKDDLEVNKLIREGVKCKMVPYETLDHKIINGSTWVNNIKLKIFGKHNLQNLNAAKLVCNELGISDCDFFKHIKSFNGAGKRLEIIKKEKNSIIFQDFAHSPSKLKATISAVKNQYKNRQLVSCLELHTFSSLDHNFLKEYHDSMINTDIAIVYYNQNTIKSKGLKNITKNIVRQSFNETKLLVFNDSKKLKYYLENIHWKNKNLLMMSSGNFDQLDLKNLKMF